MPARVQLALVQPSYGCQSSPRWKSLASSIVGMTAPPGAPHPLQTERTGGTEIMPAATLLRFCLAVPSRWSAEGEICRHALALRATDRRRGRCVAVSAGWEPRFPPLYASTLQIDATVFFLSRRDQGRSSESR